MPSLVEQLVAHNASRDKLAAERAGYCQPNCDLADKVDSEPKRIGGRWMIESRCRKCLRWLGNRPAEK